jgi:TATA-binding protein-associated factor Taf7
MEDLILLRLDSPTLQTLFKQATSEAFTYTKEKNGYQFHVRGGDSYYASMVTLPTVVDIIRTQDEIHTDQTATITRMLIVHDVTVASGLPPPSPQETGTGDGGVYPHGITPPMQHVVQEQYERNTAKVRREEVGISPEDVRDAEHVMLHYHEIFTQSMRQERSRAKPKTASSMQRTTMVPVTYDYEEVVEVEGWMKFLLDKGTVTMEKGGDQFRTSFLHTIREAKKVKEERENRLRQQREMREEMNRRYGYPGVHKS